MTTASTTIVDGDAGYRRAVDAVRDGFARLPDDAPVRLRKKTSNLFRFREGAGGLEVDGLDRVLRVDPLARTADVGGMTTYEDLVAATLPHGLMPLVVPQLKTITLGGAVVGLGIESTSFRDGLPHESVIDADVLVGTGGVVRTSREGPDADLLAGLPNSYGTLGYALRLRIELVPVRPFVRLRHVRFDTAEQTADALAEVTATRSWAGESVDFCDATVFSAGENYLSVGRMVDETPWLSDYTGQGIYYRSLQELPRSGRLGGVAEDYLTIHDYLWRWDTDWFWCSRALGAQNPVVRRFWPARWRRSDVYRRIVALDRRTGLSQALARRSGAVGVEPIIQDVEVPVDQLPGFLEFFHREIGISPVWLCPLRQRRVGAPRRWPLYPLDADTTYVNVGFWSDAELGPGQAPDHHNRRIEEFLMASGGHKSLYSTSSYTREEFDALYGGADYRELRARYDPAGRLPELYTKCVTG